MFVQNRLEFFVLCFTLKIQTVTYSALYHFLSSPATWQSVSTYRNVKHGACRFKYVTLNLTINSNVLYINRLHVGQRDGGRDEVRGVLLLQGTDTVTHLHTHILSPRWMSRGQTPPSWTS